MDEIREQEICDGELATDDERATRGVVLGYSIRYCGEELRVGPRDELDSFSLLAFLVLLPVDEREGVDDVVDRVHGGVDEPAFIGVDRIVPISFAEVPQNRKRLVVLLGLAVGICYVEDGDLTELEVGLVLESGPVLKLDANVLEINLSVVEEHPDRFSAAVDIEVVKLHNIR